MTPSPVSDAVVGAWLVRHRGCTPAGPSETRDQGGTFTWHCRPCIASVTRSGPADEGDMRRASGDVLCGHCALPYRRHPLSWHRSGDGHQFLHRLCDGTLVHL